MRSIVNAISVRIVPFQDEQKIIESSQRVKPEKRVDGDAVNVRGAWTSGDELLQNIRLPSTSMPELVAHSTAIQNCCQKNCAQQSTKLSLNLGDVLFSPQFCLSGYPYIQISTSGLEAAPGSLLSSLLGPHSDGQLDCLCALGSPDGNTQESNCMELTES